jgi:hypothetical protein
MPARDPDADMARKRFRARFRTTGADMLVYCRRPGGEGRQVKVVEMGRLIAESDGNIASAKRWFSRSVWASVLLPILFGALAARLDSPWLALLAMASLFCWLWARLVLHWRRAGWERDIWVQLERRPGVPALSRREKVDCGYAMAWWHWLWIMPLVVVAESLKVRGDIFPQPWRDIHALARIVLIGVSGMMLVGLVVFRLLKKRRPGG